MNNPHEPIPFTELVERFLDDTLAPNEAERLLEIVKNDPEKRAILREQLRTDRLLEIMHRRDRMNSIAEAVLEKTEGFAPSADRKNARRSRTFLKVAASVAILFGVGSLLTPKMKGGSDSTREAPRPAEVALDMESISKSELMVCDSVPMITEPSIPKPKLRKRIVMSSPMREDARSVTDSFGAPPLQSAPTRENYAAIVEHGFKDVADHALSTFSIDVDTASYANVRRFLNSGQLPPVDAVRIEEMINYFEYDYAAPKGADPFSTAMALADCPWNEHHQLLRIGLRGKAIDESERQPSNLVFLLDVSGSMNSANKLPLLKKGFEKMVRALDEKDRVAIVVYAGSTGVVLDSTSAKNKTAIISAMERLQAGGSTAGGAGIELAYRLASDHFIQGGVNRVILATDGDFNVGLSSQEALQKLIEEKRKSGVFLSVIGFGTGNLQDAKMETLANKGNGNYFYIDSEREAEKVLVRQLNANLTTIAKDVKIQIEFNPAFVRSYRLIGYENRALAARDFDNDAKDAGEIGAGHQVTALYELVPADAPAAEDGVPLKYAAPAEPVAAPANTTEMLTLKLRYKQPEGSTSKLLTFTLDTDARRPDGMDESFRWATAIAAFGMHLRGSDPVSAFPMTSVIDLAEGATGEDELGYRAEAVELMKRANELKTGERNPNGYPRWNYRGE